VPRPSSPRLPPPTLLVRRRRRKSILTDQVDFGRSHWAGISDEAKDFVAKLLNKDPALRPSAREALKHPWLRGRIEERSAGRPLSLAVVQRIQRHSQASLFKRSVLELIAEELLAERPEDGGGGGAAAAAGAAPACPLGEDARPLITDPSASPLEYLYARLRLADRSLVDRAALAEGLAELGYRLAPDEVGRLLDQLDPGHSGQVAKSQFAASQMDWAAVQSSHTERWLRCARRAFADLDADRDGVVSTEDMVALLRHKLPPAEVEAAVRQALEEAARRRPGSAAGSAGGSVHGPPSPRGADASQRNGLNFRQFMRMLHVGSADSLDVFDDRYGSMERAGSLPGSVEGSAASPPRPPSLDRINLLLERSVKGGDGYPRAAHLEPVIEAPDSE
jgi:calcium-dependent protein kinase